MLLSRGHISRSVAVLACLVLGLAASDAAAQATPDRLAFVVGNSAYETREDNQPLRNSKLNLVTPQTDALAYVDALEDMGWEIINEAILNRSARALRDDLATAAKQITAGSEVVFIFNGHGFSDNSTNYLVGVPNSGERYSSPGDMQTGSVSLEEVVRSLSEGGPKRIILIINACGDEPLVSNISRRPVRQDFSDIKSEVLVLYSSSPRGIAYDVMSTTERQEARMAGAGPVYSLFTRFFLEKMVEDRALLSIFTDVRIAVEHQSGFAAAERVQEGSLQNLRQIPHVLMDNIDGSFRLASAGDGGNPAAGSDWRADPRLCRVEEEARQEALQLRVDGQMATGVVGDAVSACIVEAALGDLGIAKIGYDAEERSVIVSQPNTVSSFRAGDRIALVNVLTEGEPRQRFSFSSLDQFSDLLARTYFMPGRKFAFGWKRSDGTLPASGFEARSF